MHNSKLMQVLYTADDLLEELACFLLIKLRLLDYVVEELSTADILHDEEQLLGGLYDLKELDDVWVTYKLQNFNFPCHPLHVCISHYFAFFKDFNSNLEQITIKLDFH